MIVNTQKSETIEVQSSDDSNDILFSQVFQNQLSRMVQSHQLTLPRWYLW